MALVTFSSWLLMMVHGSISEGEGSETYEVLLRKFG